MSLQILSILIYLLSVTGLQLSTLKRHSSITETLKLKYLTVNFACCIIEYRPWSYSHNTLNQKLPNFRIHRTSQYFCLLYYHFLCAESISGQSQNPLDRKGNGADKTQTQLKPGLYQRIRDDNLNGFAIMKNHNMQYCKKPQKSKFIESFF